MWIVFDIETYEQYDGTLESEESIKKQMLTNSDRKIFDKEKKKGYYYPVLNSRKFVMGCAVTDEGEERVFYDYKEMWRWIVNKIETNAKNKKKTYFYGHNIEYDISGLIKDNILDLLNANLEIINDRPFLANWEIEGKKWGWFSDTFSFFRGMSVEQIGDIVGKEKLEMPKAIKDPIELKDYCMRDCKVVLEGMQFLKESLAVLGFKPRKFLTAGQLAMTTFMSYIRRENIHWNIMRSGEVYKGNNLEKCRPAYRGGRNEAFKIGEFENVTHLDINSLYPYAMCNMPFPKLDEEMFIENPVEKGLNFDDMLNENFVGVISCDVQVPKISLGYLPVRYNNMLYFPETGFLANKFRELKGVWTTLEIKRALELGYKILKVNWICVYPTLRINVFKDYINKLYNLRKESDKGMNLAIKLMMNNLYGKFAQFRTNKEYKVIPRWKMADYKMDGWELKSIWLNKYVIQRYNEVYEPKYTNLIIAVLITAYARDYLYSFLSKIKKEDLIYCDTDSCIITNYEKRYKDLFQVSDKLGDWKVEQNGITCFVKGEKDYRIGEKIRVAGVSRRILQDMDFDKENVLIQKRKIGIKDLLREPNNFFDRFGEFKDVQVVLKGKTKRDNYLPAIVDERKDWVNIVEYLKGGNF